MSPWQKQVVIHNGIIAMKGWAYSGGGRWPEGVEVSPDGGYVRYDVPNGNLSPKHKFAWRMWHMDLPVTRKRTEEFERRSVPFAPLTRPTEFACQSEEEDKKFWAKVDPRDVED